MVEKDKVETETIEATAPMELAFKGATEQAVMLSNLHPTLIRRLKSPRLQDLEQHHKTDGTGNFATTADIKSEENVRNLIKLHFPRHGILGEELDTVTSGSEFEWIIDPIDGTISFSRGLPFAVSVGVTRNGVPYAGAVSIPQLNYTISGQIGHGIRIHHFPSGEFLGNRIPPFPGKTDTHSKLVVGFDQGYKGRKNKFDLMGSFADRITYAPSWGSAAIGAVNVLTNAWDAYVVPGQNGGATIFDLAGAAACFNALKIEATNTRADYPIMTDFSGEDFKWNKEYWENFPDVLIAKDKPTHQMMLELLHK